MAETAEIAEMAETEWEVSRKIMIVIESLHSTPLEVFSINLVMGKASTLRVGGSTSSYWSHVSGARSARSS